MESGIAQSLIGANGDTIVFNDLQDSGGAGGILMVDEIQGLDGAVLRTPTDNRPQRDGLIVHPFYQGGRIVTVTGRILPVNTLAQGITLQDRLKAACASILRADGRYTFVPSGQSTRFITVRLNDTLEIVDDEALRTGSYDPTIIKRFNLSFIAGDPGVYSLTERDTTIASGATVIVPNAGNVPARKVVAEVYGPYTAFRLTNQATGQYIAFSGLSVGSGHFIEVVMNDETADLDATGQPQLFGLDFNNSDFWQLQPGNNGITFDHITGGNGTEHVILKSNDTWA